MAETGRFSVEQLDRSGVWERVVADWARVSREIGIKRPLWKRFIEEGQGRYPVFPFGEQNPSVLLEQPSFSFLVPHNLRPPQELIKSAWQVWDDFFTSRIELKPHLTICGMMGSGKTTLAAVLQNHPPEGDSVRVNEELWQLNPYLKPFYAGLETGTNDPEVQARAQSYFASLKLIQGLWLMGALSKQIAIQDVDIRQDAVYGRTQAELGLTTPQLAQTYDRDQVWRLRLLPPYLRLPIVVYNWVPWEKVGERLKERGRKMEQQMPPKYLAHLQRNIFQWAMIMHQAGAPLLIVDSQRYDFTKPEAAAKVAESIWEQVAQIHPKLVERMRNSL